MYTAANNSTAAIRMFFFFSLFVLLIMISFIFPVTAIRCAQAATENVQQQSNSTGNAQESSSIGNAQQSGNTRPSENSINSESMENNAISNSEKSSLSESCGPDGDHGLPVCPGNLGIENSWATFAFKISALRVMKLSL